MLYLLVPALAERTISSYVNTDRVHRPLIRVNSSTGCVTFVGDTHGAIDVSAYIVANRTDSEAIVFLGDYVDRGKYQLRNLLFLVEAATMDRRIILLRGNHESVSMNALYGFKNELLALKAYESLYPSIKELYGRLPYACIVNGRVLGLHGGIPEGCGDTGKWDELPMGLAEPTDECVLQVLWNDPSEQVEDFVDGPRGPGTMIFGRNAFRRFMRMNSFELLIRGHEAKMEGYGPEFGGMLLTVFSSRYHGGKSGFIDVTFNNGILANISIVPTNIEFK